MEENLIVSLCEYTSFQRQRERERERGKEKKRKKEKKKRLWKFK